MYKVHKPSGSESYTPTSEPFIFYLFCAVDKFWGISALDTAVQYCGVLDLILPTQIIPVGIIDTGQK
jgi:hypothetical protein